MNKFLKILAPLLGLIFLILLFVSISTMVSNPLLSANQPDTGDEKSHQYAFFLPESDNAFFRNLRYGAFEAAKALDCAVIFHPVSGDTLNFEMAAYTGVNGIAVFSYEKNERMVGILEKISRAGVPIVQIENEVISSPNTFLIGTNSYDSGKSIGKIALGSEKAGLSMALIYSDKNSGLKAEANLVEMGMKSTIGNRLSQLYTESTTYNPIDAEGVIFEILQRVPDIDIIVLTDSSDTLVAIQAIIDLNLVGQVQIIGFGDEAVIREYIAKGVVLGSIVRNPHRIGFSAVAALKEINTTGYTSAYVDTGISIIPDESSSFPRTGGL